MHQLYINYHLPLFCSLTHTHAESQFLSLSLSLSLTLIPTLSLTLSLSNALTLSLTPMYLSPSLSYTLAPHLPSPLATATQGGELFDRISRRKAFTEVEASRLVRMVRGA